MTTALEMTTNLESLESDFQNLGYAKVIVALKPQIALGRPDATEAELGAHFFVPSEPQATRLAFVAARTASRSFHRSTQVAQRKVRIYPHLGLAIGYVNRQGATALAGDNRVDTVVAASEMTLIRPVSLAAAPSSTAPTWGIERLRAPALWAAGFTGKGVLVGHLDTGIDATHPALMSALDEFAEFDMAGDRVPGAKPWDSDKRTPNHGTHTAGTIAGRPTRQRTVGVAPDAKLASGMVIEGGQVIDRILSGLDWVLSKNVRILSMSLGLPGFTSAFQVIIDALRSHNVLPVIAIGNEGPNSSRSPGNYTNVLSVGAMDQNNIVADFSGSQTFNRPDDPLVPDLVAPGVGVISCGPNNTYVAMDGTSMATPHIAGLAALLLQAKPAATAEELESAIFSSCSLPTGMFQARGNRGVPDAVVAFEKLTGNQLPAAVASAAAPAPRRAARGGATAPGRTAAAGRRSRSGGAKPTKKRRAGKARQKRGKGRARG
jgi:subtilisin